MRLPVEEAATRLEELAQRALAGEEIILTREGKVDIRLEPLPGEEWPRVGYEPRSSV